MALLLFPLGLLPLVLIGWIALRLLEGARAVLSTLERWVYAAIIGPTLCMYWAFVLSLFTLVHFTLGGFLASFVVLLAPLSALWLIRRKQWPASPLLLPSAPLSRRGWIIIAILGAWVTLKLIAGVGILLSDPAYNDDVFNNWNRRAKIIADIGTLPLAFPGDNIGEPGVNAYPPTVPMLRAWLALAGGGWDDRLVGLTAPLWYLLALAIIFCTLRRILNLPWAIVGTYILSSLPLLLIHGATPYADLLVALSIAAALLPLLSALREDDPTRRRAWLRIGALATALLPFTKNETLLMHLPPLLLLLACALALWVIRGRMHRKEALATLAWYVGFLALILVPWLGYKLGHGLTFGNAKPIGGVDLTWQPNVLRSLWITIILEANFLFLPGLLLALLIARWRTALFSPAVILTIFILIVSAGIVGIFLFTSLSAEALKQTGSARGFLQIMPIAVILVTILLENLWKTCGRKQRE
jgi:hypothetical protein